MQHTYSIDLCAYDGGYSTPGPGQAQRNPLVWIYGTVDGQRTVYVPVFWSAIQRAFAFGGTAGVQAFFAPILLGMITGPPFPPAPMLPNTPVNIPAPVTGLVFPNNTVN